jgi:hypothetical protein
MVVIPETTSTSGSDVYAVLIAVEAPVVFNSVLAIKESDAVDPPLIVPTRFIVPTPVLVNWAFAAVPEKVIPPLASSLPVPMVTFDTAVPPPIASEPPTVNWLVELPIEIVEVPVPVDAVSVTPATVVNVVEAPNVSEAAALTGSLIVRELIEFAGVTSSAMMTPVLM